MEKEDIDNENQSAKKKEKCQNTTNRTVDEMKNEGNVERTTIEMEFVNDTDSNVTTMNEKRYVEIQSVEGCEDCQYANMTKCEMRNIKSSWILACIFVHIFWIFHLFFFLERENLKKEGEERNSCEKN